MFTFKGFVSNSTFTNNNLPNISGNTPGDVAPIGQISTLSMTYSQDQQSYVSTVNAALTLIGFTSNINGTAYVLSQADSNHILAVANSVYTYCTGTGQITATALLNSLLATYAGTDDNFSCGQIVTDGTNYFPEWVQWTNTSLSDIATNVIKIWFADSSFQNEFDDYKIIVIPPLTNLNDFFNSGTQVAAEIAAVTSVQQITAIQTAKNGCPETILRADTFNYIDPNNSANVVPTTWYTLIYGAAGNNVDSVSDALTTYILANSSHSQADWTTILPDLFRRTEFVIVPLWDNYAIPNSQLQAGIYSPVANLANTQALIVQVEPSYPSVHIDTYAEVLGFPYKSIALGIIGSPNNKNNWYQITNVFPDFVNIVSTSNDFNRMSQATQNFSLLIYDMLIGAETLTTYSSVPTGMTKMTRDNILYLVQSYENIHFLVAAKSNFPLA